MQLILNGDTRPVLFFLTAAADHIAGLAGASPTVTISKNGAAFGAHAGAVAEVGDGWYRLIPAGADVTTNGIFLLHAVADGADPVDVKCQVVAFDPYDAAPTLPEITGGVLETALPESYADNGQAGHADPAAIWADGHSGQRVAKRRRADRQPAGTGRRRR